MDNIYTLTPTKQVYNLFKWLSANCSTDKLNETITNIHKVDTILQASNGFTLAICKLEEVILLPDGNYKVISLNKKAIVLEKMETSYPNIRLLIREEMTEVRNIGVAMKSKYICMLVEPFSYFTVNIENEKSIVQFSLIPDFNTFPEGEYLGLLAPFYTEYEPAKTTLEKFKNLKTLLPKGDWEE